jgi:type IV pilus assembly protein PilN
LELTDKIQVAQKNLAKYQAEEREVKKIRAELQKLKDKMNVIAQLEANRSGPVRIMDALTHLVIRDKMWLKTLKKSTGEMRLEGVAIDNKTVADFMTRLERSPLFGVVNLIASKQITQGNKKFKEFTITCQLAKQKIKKKT